MILKPRLVPAKIWKVCFRNSISQYKWQNKVSRPIREAAKQLCEICGQNGQGAVPEYSTWPLCCDEVWEYITGEVNEAKLVDLMSICWFCNSVIHFGRTCTVESKETIHKVFDHALKVNKCTRDEMNIEIKKQEQIWMTLSALSDWIVTWENWEVILNRKLKKEG